MKWRTRLSLKIQLTAWYTLSSMAVVFTATMYLYWSLVMALHQRNEKFFLSRKQAITAALSNQDRETVIRRLLEREWTKRTPEVFYARVSNAQGRTIASSPDSEFLFQRLSIVGAPLSNEKTLPQEVLYSEGQLFLIVTFRLTEGDDHYLLQIALERSEEPVILAGYRKEIAEALVVCFLVSALVCYQIAHRGLRPLRDIARKAARINSSNLEERMGPAKLPSEVAHLAKTFDAMLDRLAASFERLQRFSADIAHEIRTPISNISGELQLALGKDRSPEYYKEAIGSCLEECHRISRITDSLLFLARAENPRLNLPTEPIHLRSELETVLEFYEAVASERGVTCELSVPESIFLYAERTLFQRAIGNILSNAISKTRSSGTIQVCGFQTVNEVHIEIKDTGEGIPAEHMPYLFDRFYRVDASRTQGSGGAGLGLAIVKSIASIHGGDVSLRSRLGVGTVVSISFPTRRSVVSTVAL